MEANHGGTGNGERGIEHHPVALLTLTLDLTTHQVAIGGQSLPLSLAQMIVGEGMRLLEEQRRMAAAQMLRQQLVEQVENDRIAAALRSGRA